MTVLLVVAAYLLFLLLGSFRNPGDNSSADNFLLAGRRLTLLPFVATMVTTAYGWILGIGELYYQYGISAWLFLSLPYTLFALIMAFFLSGKIREEKIHSVPELLEKHYGKKVARLGSIAVFLSISPAMYALMCAQIFHGIFPIPMWLAVVGALFFSSIYLYKGGFALLAKKDTWKFLFMFGGFALVLAWLFLHHGALPLEGMPSETLHFELSAHFWEILTWFLLALMVFADPGFHQRIYSTQSNKTAQKGLLISVLCWTFFDFLAASVALYGLGLMPGLENSAQVFPLLAENQLPSWLGAVFILGLLATVMSTLDSFLFLSAQTLMYDLFNKKQETARYMRIGLVISSLLTFFLLLPYLNGSAVGFFYDFAPYVVCILVPPVLSVFIPSLKIKGAQVWIQMILSLAVCILWNLIHLNNDEALNAVIPGMSIALLSQFLFLLLNKRTGIQK